MNLFRKFEQPNPPESVFIERAETAIDILASDLKKRDWTEVCDYLRHSELNIPAVTGKMSAEAQVRFKALITETGEIFMKERASVPEDLVEAIQEGLDHIQKGFEQIQEKI